MAIYEHHTGFAGDDTVRQMIEGTRTGAGADHIEPLNTECGRLGDTLFLQYGLEDYSVPPLFDREIATGYRVFAKNEKFVAQVRVKEHGMTFLVFRADQQGVNIQPPGHWKFLTRRRLVRRRAAARPDRVRGDFQGGEAEMRTAWRRPARR